MSNKIKDRIEQRWYQEPSFWIIIGIFVLVVFTVYFLPERKTNEPIYKELPCYYLSEPGIGQLVGINESDYSKIKILTDSKNSSRFTVLDTRNESNIKEIPLCELWK
jgi:hypothetical protein